MKKEKKAKVRILRSEMSNRENRRSLMKKKMRKDD